jgi:phosphoenolpyruvate carboxykinase (ATP)
MQPPLDIPQSVSFRNRPPAEPVAVKSAGALGFLGDLRRTVREPSPEGLARIAVASGQCSLARSGALILLTGSLTGRAPRDRYIVKNAVSEDTVEWGTVNQPLTLEHFRALSAHLERHLASHDTFLVTRHAGGPEGLPLRLVTTSAAHALFGQHLFQEPRAAAGLEPITILHSPECFAVPELHGTRGGTFIVLDLASRTILIGGTGYAGEIKKSVFSLLNFLLPERGILTMHAAVNLGDWGDSAVFFGLSGTGKTTLSTDSERHLLGDDEHGWSDAGVFNLEGGCYAKTINLSAQLEPDIWRAVHRPLTLVENVVVDPASGEIDWRDSTITENTRAAYPLGALDRLWPHATVRPPSHVLFLAADAFGVLPPVARLSLDQAVYYFLSGYSAKLAGTEAGQLTPQPTFSACFGAPFMPRPARVYAELLRQRVQAAGASVWLVNTGWVGGAYGEGQRMPIDETRAIVRAILSSTLELGPTRVEPHFGLTVPTHVPSVRASILDPRASWRDGRRYDEQARALRERFDANLPR